MFPNGEEADPNDVAGGFPADPNGMVGGAVGAGDPKGENPAAGAPKGLLFAGGAAAAPKPPAGGGAADPPPNGPAGGGAPKKLLLFAAPKPPNPAMVKSLFITKDLDGKAIAATEDSQDKKEEKRRKMGFVFAAAV